ncbi:septum formation family protein [Protaetiibacter mangrovi]|uniref:Septum formation family protein n=1 Tax=Protaetiibacter mangrovi TaxID=2970926 RepID=A0ABT1ZCH7_9MICO|nr:septum formation family protein [Protaetiibacter mangrovi]MCS0498396.1 septum formation family protein [Protaetiibacter mangrovi]
MNDRPRDDDEQSASDWLAAQFGSDDEPTTVPPATAPPPPLVNPFGTVPPAQPTAPPVPPVQPTPPPAWSPAPVPPAPTAPPASPPTAPPTAPPAAPPAAPPGAEGGFAWGLRPGTAAPVGPPTPPSVPPAAPSTLPPVAPPPASAPPVPPALVEPAAPEPAAWAPPPLVPGIDGAAPPAAPPPAPMPFETARLPEVAPDAGDAPSWEQPTQLIDAVPSEAAAPTPPPVFPAPAAADVAATELLGASAIAQDAGTTSALETLFGEDRFRDYDAEPDPRGAPAAVPVETGGDPVERAGVSRAQKVLLGVAGGLVALLALVALFLLGTRLPALTAEPTPTPTPSATPTPTPTPTVLPAGPVAPGVWAWDALLGGECLDPFDDPWAEEFTVVDCAAPHPAQLVYRGTLAATDDDPSDDPFPGTEALQGQMSLLCTAPGVVDLAAAGQYSDAQFQGTYPANEEEWDAGDRTYYCFVSRSSGEPLTGSLAVPQAPPAG